MVIRNVLKSTVKYFNTEVLHDAVIYTCFVSVENSDVTEVFIRERCSKKNRVLITNQIKEYLKE